MLTNNVRQKGSLLRRIRGQNTAFDYINYIILILIGAAMLFPFLNVLARSFSSEYGIISGRVSIFPVEFNVDSYRYILQDWALWRSMFVTMYVAAFGTLCAMAITLLMAYPLSKPRLRARKGILLAVIFIMIFGLPIIPFFLVVKSTGLLNNIHSLIIPSLINPFNLLVLKTFLENVPQELEESAKMDGANDWQVLWRIFIPLALPAIAAISLFYAVEKWNSYAQALMFLNDRALWPLQVKARMMFTVGRPRLVLRGVRVFEP